MSKKTATSAVRTNTLSLNARAEECLQRRDYDGARQYLDQSLQCGKTKEAYRMRGFVASMDKDLPKALDLLDAALDIDENDPETICALGDVYSAANEPVQALGYFMLAMQMAPNALKYKQRFLLLARLLNITQHNAAIEEAVFSCLQTPGLECGGLMGGGMERLWYDILVTKPPFQDLLTASADAPALNAKAFDGLTDFSPFLAPYFLHGLKKLVISRTDIEELLTALRRKLPDLLSAETEKYLPLAAALADYCFATQYVFYQTDEEAALVEDVRARIEDAGDMKDKKNDIALFGCYAPLSDLANSGAIVRVFANNPVLKDMIDAQITDVKKLHEKEPSIPALTKIADETSAKVRAQYEIFPYPAWQELPVVPLFQEDFMRDFAREEGKTVLVAGCGTGHEPLWLARFLPRAEVLAVDLSRASLAYAENKRVELGVNNVRFAQADILQLGDLEQTFDMILCGGVLHHMADPVAGWRVLTGLLKPEGLMKIGLYSELARREIVTALRIIKEKNYPATAEGIRAFRHAARGILPREAFEAIARSMDFYRLPMCRDLLFHAQEHRFDIPKLKDALEKLDLSFMQMSEESIVNDYRAEYPDDPVGANLDQWDAFEKAHPGIFGGMYQFWCKKK